MKKHAKKNKSNTLGTLAIILLLSSVLLVMHAGCISQKEKDDHESPTNGAPAEKMPEIDELRGDILKAIGNVKSYSFKSEKSTKVGQNTDKEVTEGYVDLLNKRKKYDFDGKVTIDVAGEDFDIDTTIKGFVIDGVHYTNPLDVGWIKMDVDFEDENLLNYENYENYLADSIVMESTILDGKMCWLVKCFVNASDFVVEFIEFGELDEEVSDEAIENSKNPEIHLWIDKRTNLPVKESKSIETIMNKEKIFIVVTTRYDRYNEEFSIELPEEAKSAEDINETTPLPPVVNETIISMSKVHTYAVKFTRELVRGSRKDIEFFDINVDQDSKKLINVNTFYVDDDEGEIKTYVDRDKAYMNSVLGWFKSDTEWVKENPFSILTIIMMQGKLDIKNDTIDGKEVMLFEIKSYDAGMMEDIYDIGLFEGNTESEKEELLSEIMNEAENYHVKIWVDKDTFIPIKSEQYLESKYNGNAMSIRKSGSYSNYDLPIMIDIPGEAYSAEDLGEEFI